MTMKGVFVRAITRNGPEDVPRPAPQREYQTYCEVYWLNWGRFQEGTFTTNDFRADERKGIDK